MRTLRTAIAALLSASIVAGCDHDTSLEGDGTVGDAASGDAVDGRDGGDVQPIDASDAPDDTTESSEITDGSDGADGEETTCTGTSYWQLAERTLDSVELLSASRVGATDRLLVRVQLHSSCERLARVDLDVMSGDATDFVEIAAWAWTPVGLDCLPDAPLARWIVEIEGRMQGNLRAVVSDAHSPASELLATYERTPCSGPTECWCGPGSPVGTGTRYEACLTDCACGPGLSCIGFFGIGGPLWECLQPCNDFLDCGLRGSCPAGGPDGPPWVCEEWGENCADDTDCPDGYTCMGTGAPGTYCEDRRAPPTIADCTCDADCPVGQWCTLGFRDRPTCEIPCLRDADCPMSGGTAYLVCAAPAVCVPLE